MQQSMQEHLSQAQRLHQQASEELKQEMQEQAREREELGEHVTNWVRNNPNARIIDKIVTQSSDREFHCLTITIFYENVQAAA